MYVAIIFLMIAVHMIICIYNCIVLLYMYINMDI